MPMMTSQILKFKDLSKNKNLNILREKHYFLENEKIVYSYFIISACLSKRELVNRGNRGKHHCSWIFREESIKEAKGSTNFLYPS